MSRFASHGGQGEHETRGAAAVSQTLRVTLAGALALTVSLALAVPGASARSGARHQTRHTVAGGHQSAPAALAAGVLRARSSRARQRALLALMRGVGVGVYTPTGRQLVGGLERGPDSIYLYDFEIRALSDQLARRSRESFDQLAAELDAAGLTVSGRSPTGPSLASDAARGIRALHGHARTVEGTLGLVVRDLGISRHVDLARRQSPAKAVLDPLQALLLTIDAARSDASGRAGHLSHAARAAPLAQAAGCEGGNFIGSAGSGGLIGSAILSGGGISERGARGIMTKVILDGIHGIALAYSFSFSAVQSSLTGTFGQNGYHSAKPMLFQVRATLHDGIGADRVACGALAGQKPSAAGIPVTWDPDWVGHLDYLGTVTCGAGCTATDPDGIATLSFQPDDEYLPDVGPTIVKSGNVLATAHPQQAAGNLLGTIAETVGLTKNGVFGWAVSFHDPSGYRVDIPTYSLTTVYQGSAQVSATFTDTFSNMEVCSRSPDLPHPTEPNVAIGTASDPKSSLSPTWSAVEVLDGNPLNPSGPADIPMAAAPNFPIAFGSLPAQGYGDGSQVSGQWQFDGTSLQAQITVAQQILPEGLPNPATISPPSQTFNLPVTEAQGCPSVLGR